MLSADTKIKIVNRDSGTVGYAIPELHIRRRLEPGSDRMVSWQELRLLSQERGGKYLIKNCLIVCNKQAVCELFGVNVEPEYYYDQKTIKKLLESGSIEQLQDCLNFAPKSVINLVQEIAVDMELNDVRKRELIQKKTSFNVSAAIQHKHEAEEEEQEKPKETITRKAAPIAEVEDNSGRRAAPIEVPKDYLEESSEPAPTNKYSVVSE